MTEHSPASVLPASSSGKREGSVLPCSQLTAGCRARSGGLCERSEPSAARDQKALELVRQEAMRTEKATSTLTLTAAWRGSSVRE